MTFEVAFKRYLLFPGLIQSGEDKPRPSKSKKVWSHTVGGQDAAPFPSGQTQGQPGAPAPEEHRNFDERGGRELSTISPGEVDAALSLYQSQLLHTDDGALIRKNSFYTIPLRRHSGAPSFIFGRVNVAMPSEGHIQDVEEMELAFPQPENKPERVVLEPHHVDLRKQVQSYRFRVKIFGTEDERSDFTRHERRFSEAGFALDFGNDLVEFLDSHEMDDETLPWFHVIGSSWFAGFPSNLQDDIRACLWKLSVRETLLINYHLTNVKSLNDELDYQYRLSDFYLTNPKSPDQTLRLIKTTFNKIFDDPSSKSAHLSNRQGKVR